MAVHGRLLLLRFICELKRRVVFSMTPSWRYMARRKLGCLIWKPVFKLAGSGALHKLLEFSVALFLLQAVKE